MTTWAQLDQHRKPIVLANIENFWDPFITLMDHMREEAFIRQGLEVAIDIAPSGTGHRADGAEAGGKGRTSVLRAHAGRALLPRQTRPHPPFVVFAHGGD